ncbi:hypothetical protein RB195_022290 [Necator americanus]|uniref:Aconitate hydratase n=1 Tax=Necator americanus TaxID=51031 RepID=A0ABR1EEP4_NECAM
MCETVYHPEQSSIVNAYVLLYLGDSVTTDHISPAGSISKISPAARFLEEKGCSSKDFNTYGARRGNDEGVGICKRMDTVGMGSLSNLLIVRPLADAARIPRRRCLVGDLI